MDSLSRIQHNREEAPSCSYPSIENNNAFAECSEPFDEKDFQEYQRLTKTSCHSAGEKKFKKGDDLALDTIVLGGGFLLGGPIGLGLGALLLAASCHPVEEIGVADNKADGGDGGGTQERCMDDGNQIVTSSTTIADNIYYRNHTHIVWTGSEYGISWQNLKEKDSTFNIFFSRLDAQGNKIGDETQIANRHPSSVWTDDTFLSWNKSQEEYALFWSEDRSIVFARVEKNGHIISNNISAIQSEYETVFPRAVWNDLNLVYGVSWIDLHGNDPLLKFARVDSFGHETGIGTTIDIGIGSPPAMTWNGSEYGINWPIIESRTANNDVGEMKFSRIHDAGDRSATVNIFRGSSWLFNPTLAWLGNEYGVAWDDQANDAIDFARIDASGNQIGATLKIADSANNVAGNTAFGGQPTLVVVSEEKYGLSWADERDGHQGINFVLLNKEGNTIGQIIPITNNSRATEGPPVSYSASLVWTGCNLGIVWLQEQQMRVTQLKFARIVPTTQN